MTCESTTTASPSVLASIRPYLAFPGVLALRALLVLVVLAGVVAACSDDTPDDGEAQDGNGDQAAEASEADAVGDGVLVVDDCSDEVADGRLCVGLVTGLSSPADIGLQNSTREAVLSWGDDNDITVTELTADSGSDLGANIDLLAERGYGVVVVPVQEGTSALVGAVSTHPEVHFIGVDQIGLDEADNLVVVTFSNHEVGFLAGALAGLLTESGDVAQVLGSALVPPIADLEDGFINGVAYTNSRADVAAFFHPGDLETAFVDPGWGASTAAGALESGADVIFATGGVTGHGALAAAAESGDSVFCIGVDFDKWDVVPDAQPCLVNSVVKDVTEGLEDALDAVADGKPLSGEIVGHVNYSDYHDFADDVPSEIRQAADNIAKQLRAGEITAARRR